MRLTSAHVVKFKSITDSGVFAIDEKVTALVGKNESGKTATLEAMYRHKPLPSGHRTDFNELRDYPRRYRAKDKAIIAATSPIALTYLIEDEDRAAVADKFGPNALTGDQVKVSRQYGDKKSTFWDLAVDELLILRHLIDRAGLDPDRYIKGDLAATVAALRADEGAAAALTLADNLEKRDVEGEVRTLLSGRLPKFQYFDDYNILPGAVSVCRLQNEDEDDLEAGERTALALLRLAGVEGEEFTETEYESRKAALEAAANALTDELFEYWTQNDNLEVELDIEFRPTSVGASTTEPWLQIRVKNTKHRVTLNMDERSKGFIWFFSFLAAFSEYADTGRRIILLDEPGLNLHAKAQNDLLRFIDDRLAPHHQVIYSTHSLFMIEPNELERCRTVEDVADTGTKVSQDIWSARADTVFPLLGALGVDLTQTLIIGPDQLLVEGPADVTYLTVMSDVVRRNGGTPLDPRWKITPVGGIDKIPTFVALLGGELNVTVVMDVAAGGNQKITNLVKRGLLDQQRLVPLTDITGTPEADIEDLFEQQWYLKLLKASGVGTITKAQLTGGRIVKQVEAALGHAYDHFQPASHLMRDPGTLLDSIDDPTQQRFSSLFARLNALLS